ncbi:hypothetical protein CCR75_000764 [Bremia lactucae]|uniref:GATOR1 complex protein NPRL3 C-terminal HTH domain-containing protein n=1 Tax=Bremia lactucae TaxID=4779 RepID=A0A976IHT7_BRELC|nr:hypothetical protein CCR75_000764 [Bremia lactucae]
MNSGSGIHHYTSGCRLLGVALVVDDINKGCNLAFRYPAPSSEKASSFQTLPAPLLAKLFRPKNALCNASFELVVDELRFVSHPVLVSPRLPSVAPSTDLVSSLVTPSTVVEQSIAGSQSSTGNETTMFNIIFALDDRPLKRSQATTHTPQIFSSDGETQARQRRTAKAYSTVAAQLAHGLLHEELRVGFVSKEVRELLQVRDELAQSERHARSKGTGGTVPNATGPSSSAPNLASCSSNTSTNNTNSTATSNGSTGLHHPRHRKDNDKGLSTVEVDPQTLIDVSLGKSVLANELKRVFHGLDESGAAHIVLNGWIKLSLTLTDAVTIQMATLRPYHTLLLLVEKGEILQKLPVDHARQLEIVVKTVNPLKSFQDIALESSVPIHQVFRLAAHLVYWGFGRIVDAITLYNVYQVTANANVHVGSPLAVEFRRTFEPYELSEVLSTFSGSRRIGEYMKTLSTAKKTEYIHMLLWLLQHRFIVQLHRYVYFMIPSDGEDVTDRSHSAESSSSAMMASNLQREMVENSAKIEALLPLDPAAKVAPTLVATAEERKVDKGGNSDVPLAQVMSVASQVLFSEQERAYLAKIAKPNPVFTLFKRLCIYFHGEHHIEEIMWRENLSRGELRTVMSTYQDIIVSCLRE